MLSRWSAGVALAIAAVWLMAGEEEALAAPRAKAAKLCARSSSNAGGYTVGKATYSQVTLRAELAEGGGAGSLTLDPNQHLLDESGEVTGGTKLPLTTFEVKLVPTEKPHGSGPATYRLEGEDLPERMSLLAPKKAGGPWRLVVADQKGIPQRTFLLEP